MENAVHIAPGVAKETNDEFAIVPLAKIRPMAGQPRRHFSEAGLKSLAQSIQAEGLDNPIKVRRIPGTDEYEIIDGERRWRACRLIMELERVEVIIRNKLAVKDQHFMSLRLNFNRENHTHIEVSDALHRERQAGRSVRELAEGLGKSEVWVYQYLNLQKLIPELRKLMVPPTPKKQMLRFAVAQTIAGAPKERQMQIYEEVHLAPTAKQKLRKAQQLTGEATGRRDESEREVYEQVRIFNRAIPRIVADVEEIMDMPNKVFQKLIADKDSGEIRRMRTQLDLCQQQLSQLSMVLKTD